MDQRIVEGPGDDDEVRAIEAAPISHRYARGWHCLGLAKTYRDGKPHGIDIFGTKIVVFEGEDGRLNALNAWCPHMGADLSQGEVRGNAVACPFHDWRWEGDGRCALIPYARFVPPKARTRSWPVLEQNKQLFVWNDPEGNPPPPTVTIPRLEGCFNGEWSEWSWETIEIETNVRELIDNVADVAHFFYVHGFGKSISPKFFKNVFENHVAAQYMEMYEDGVQPVHDRHAPYQGLAQDLRPGVFRSEGVYYGPSYMINGQWRHITPANPNLAQLSVGTLDAVLINCHYPITPNRFMLQVGSMVRLNPNNSPTANAELAYAVSQQLRDAFFSDVRIWQSKVRIDNPLLCHADGPVYQLRRWYEQFYRDVGDVDRLMTERFEFEADLDYPNKIWDEQRVENIEREARRLGVTTDV